MIENPFLWFTLLFSSWAVWRVARWIGSGGRLPLRGRRGTAAAFGSAAMAVQALYGPAARHSLEQKQEEELQREDDDEGGE